ncbi:hypothetical protein Prum_048340 [Phytohabitans rumicis]|uniref:Uncharacterized protein n=1 Tax=Phytohabitans rumicis TaxID=1076125 RepID=A0A6V8L1M9_9ACTN|nr:hypothetical protein Prum_048340 [Phytohabitans rumicis]
MSETASASEAAPAPPTPESETAVEPEPAVEPTPEAPAEPVATTPEPAADAEPVAEPHAEPVTAALEVRETVRLAVPERVVAIVDDERPFWMPVQEMPRGSARPPQRVRPGRPPKPPRRPATGLIALLVFGLLATFFAWVSAEPLWLAVGHGKTGTATVTECTGAGVGQRCLGEFTATSGAFTAERVRLLGVGEQRDAGTTVAARMVAADSARAYVDAATSVLHLRWGLGMALVLLCGAGIAWSTGALRLETRRARRQAAALSVAAPVLVAVAFLAATF